MEEPGCVDEVVISPKYQSQYYRDGKHYSNWNFCQWIDYGRDKPVAKTAANIKLNLAELYSFTSSLGYRMDPMPVASKFLAIDEFREIVTLMGLRELGVKVDDEA